MNLIYMWVWCGGSIDVAKHSQPIRAQVIQSAHIPHSQSEPLRSFDWFRVHQREVL